MKALIFLSWLAVGTMRAFADGWAFMVLWGWFVSPLGVIHIGLWQAMGLDLSVGAMIALAGRRRTEDADASADLAYAAAKLLIAPTVVGFGWLIHLGMQP